MSQFGANVEKFSGQVEVEINKLRSKSTEAEIKSISNHKGIKRPTFEWNDKSYQALRDCSIGCTNEWKGFILLWMGFC